MARIESFDGKEAETTCLGCDMWSGKIEFSRGMVAKTRNFSVHQDFEVPIPGFFILDSRKHVSSILGFSQEEWKELMALLYKTRKGMKEILGIKEVLLFQNEASPHPHFHLWMLPKAEWMGGKAEANPLKSILDYAKQNLKTKENLKKVDEAVSKMRKYMEKEKRGVQ